MIRNEKQYRIATAQVRRFQEGLDELAAQKRPSSVTPRLWTAQSKAVESQIAELRQGLEAYDRLQSGGSKGVFLETVEDLPKALIRARIAAGLTQASLARRLGIKPQQVQRYEATEYESASLARVLKVVRAVGLRMPKTARSARKAELSTR